MNLAVKKELARELFLNTALTQKVIATRVDVTEKTIGKWIADGKWDRLKELKTVTRSELLGQALLQLKTRNQQINELDPKDFKNLKILTDSQAVIIKQIELLSDNPLHVYIGVIEELIDYCGKTAPDRVKELTQDCFNFIEAVNARQK